MIGRVIVGTLALTVLMHAHWDESERTAASVTNDPPPSSLFDADSMAIHYYRKYCGSVCRYDEDWLWFRRTGEKRTVWYFKEIRKGGWCLDLGFEFDKVRQRDIQTRSASAFHWLDRHLTRLDTSRIVTCQVFVNDTILACSGADYLAFKEQFLRSLR